MSQPAPASLPVVEGTGDTVRLPANAYMALAPGEAYQPIVPATSAPPEATRRSVVWGVSLCIVFTVASAYSGLKVGQVMEASIPISILAIGLARAYQRRSTLLENVILTGIGGTSGGVVAGAIFTLPALYTLGLDPHPAQTIFICLAGGCLGVLFLIPLRRYFVRDTHGDFPYPEATAITEVLVTGERGGSQARLLLQATAVAGVYDFFVTTFQVWREFVDLQFVPAVKTLADQARMVLAFDAVAFILGLGFVMGLRSSAVLVAGGILSNLVLVPLIWMIGQQLPDAVYPGTVPIANMTAAQIFRGYVRFIGVGAIATAGIFGIIKSLRIVAASFGIAARAFRHGESTGERTDHDLPVQAQLIGVVVAAVTVAAFFGTLLGSPSAVALALLLTLVFSFFFTSVAATAIATIARNPVSGMTMLTVIISSVVLLRFGVSGQSGMFFVMAIAGMVCTALSVSGQTITDLKTGYWLGSTPSAQERVKFLGVIASAAAVGLTIVMLARAFQFGEAVPGRHARRARGAAGVDHAGARPGLHEPAARGLGALQHRRDDRSGDGDAPRAGAGVRPRHVPAARAEPAGAGGGRAVLRGERPLGTLGSRRPCHARARRHRCVRLHGGRSTWGCPRRGPAALQLVSRGPGADAVLRSRGHLAVGLARGVLAVRDLPLATGDQAAVGGGHGLSLPAPARPSISFPAPAGRRGPTRPRCSRAGSRAPARIRGRRCPSDSTR